jgi:hypothetical protein
MVRGVGSSVGYEGASGYLSGRTPWIEVYPVNHWPICAFLANAAENFYSAWHIIAINDKPV